jgi:hypothetical protein
MLKGGVVNFTPRSLYPQDITPVPIEKEAGWAPKSTWIFGEKENLLSLPGFEPWTKPIATMTTLHRLQINIANTVEFTMNFISDPFPL